MTPSIPRQRPGPCRAWPALQTCGWLFPPDSLSRLPSLVWFAFSPRLADRTKLRIEGPAQGPAVPPAWQLGAARRLEPATAGLQYAPARARAAVCCAGWSAGCRWGWLGRLTRPTLSRAFTAVATLHASLTELDHSPASLHWIISYHARQQEACPPFALPLTGWGAGDTDSWEWCATWLLHAPHRGAWGATHRLRQSQGGRGLQHVAWGRGLPSGPELRWAALALLIDAHHQMRLIDVGRGMPAWMLSCMPGTT